MSVSTLRLRRSEVAIGAGVPDLQENRHPAGRLALLGYKKTESTFRGVRGEFEDALAIAEVIEIYCIRIA